MPPRRARRLAFLAPYALVSAVHVGAKLVGAKQVDRATKPLLLPLLAVRLLARPRPSGRTTGLLAASLAAGWIGDVTIDRSFRAGLGAFLVGHLGFIALFSSVANRRPLRWSLLAVPWLGAVLAALPPKRSGGLFPAIAVYGSVLGAMAASAARVNARTSVGGILFVLSDTLLALRRLTPWLASGHWGVGVMSSYLAAQALLVDGALDAEREAGHRAATASVDG